MLKKVLSKTISMTPKKLFISKTKEIMIKVVHHNNKRETTQLKSSNSSNKELLQIIEMGTLLGTKDTKAPQEDILDQTLITSLPRIMYWGMALVTTLGTAISLDLIKEGQARQSLKRRAAASNRSR